MGDQGTTLSVKEIAERLHFGAPKSASLRLLTALKNRASNDSEQACPGI